MLQRETVDGTTSRFPFFQGKLPGKSDFERLRFFSEDSKFTMRNVALAGKMAAVLYLLFSILDFFVYPEFFKIFLALRVCCSLIVLFIAWFSTKNWARKRYRLFATLVPLTAAFFISLMIYMVDDPQTQYYAGLNLCIVGTGTLFQWTSREAMITSLLVFAMFLAATFPRLQDLSTVMEISIFGGNCLFIVSTAILVIVGAYNHNNFRFGEFVVRAKLRKNQAALEEKNQKLKETLEALSDTEKQLYQSDKMAFLGQLSAGVIHEIGNPLNYSNQALFLLRKRLNTSGMNGKIEEMIDDIQEGMDRIRAIVSDLREFSHVGSNPREPFPISECLWSSLRIMKKTIHEMGAKVETDIDEELLIVGVKNQITQVITNLIHNAVQAMATQREPGLLKIVVEKRDEGTILVQVTDIGPGISPENLKTLFDPFFTTKDPGEGTGLGLSIAYRIIEAHGGELKVNSQLGVGTTFTLVLPSAQKSLGDEISVKQ